MSRPKQTAFFTTTRPHLARPAYPPTARRFAMARSMHVVPVTSSEVSVTSFCHDVREIMLSVGFRNQAGGNYQLVHLRRNPAVLGVAGRNSTGLLIHPTQLFEVIARHRIAFGFRINAVHARGVEAEDAPLYVIGQRFPTKTLHQLVGHFQPAKSFDLPLRRAPPDRVGSPQDVVGAEGIDDEPTTYAASSGLLETIM